MEVVAYSLINPLYFKQQVGSKTQHGSHPEELYLFTAETRGAQTFFPGTAKTETSLASLQRPVVLRCKYTELP